MTSINNNESIKDIRLFEKIKSEKNVKQAENNMNYQYLIH